ncbi:transporter associated domain-containing protein [Wohlfahrtiimonas sp. G9077]|uniref:transporter associated domain-containing protein n=1 Tax=Wohlfahrtiimonas sp. G9077 TaxID=1980118 RepID=UPI000B97DCEE|nr:transporter associated domain-containing protein [Wohlfahrtiimonas sp. G9077]OYQ74419.1 peptide ABC transporter ATP-binding protein [Wohlfahrtiimonas sp. G9077]
MSDDPSPSRKSWLSRLGLERKNVTLNNWNTELTLLQKEGKIDSEAVSMIRSVLSSQTLTVRDIMVPRAHMISVAIDDDFDESLQKIIQSGHSRIPVLAEDHEEVQGILLTKDLLHKMRDPSIDVATLLRPVEYVPEGKYVIAQLNEFRAKHSHMALVVDEYGAVSGLVTIEDIIEQIVGEIDDEHDFIPADEEIEVEQVDENHYIVDAKMSLEEFNERFGTHFVKDEVETISGLVMTQVGFLPNAHSEVVIDELKFKVLPYDGKMLDKLEVEPNKQSGNDS